MVEVLRNVYDGLKNAQTHLSHSDYTAAVQSLKKRGFLTGSIRELEMTPSGEEALLKENRRSDKGQRYEPIE